MNFKIHRIRNTNQIRATLDKLSQQNNLSDKSTPPPRPPRHYQHFTIITAIVVLTIVIGLIWLIYAMISSLDFGSLIFNFGKELQADKSKHTNFLLLGNGGEGHDGANLTDTILVASLDQNTKTVKMLSIPRDFYIKDPQTGGQRINKLYDSYYNLQKNDRAALSEVSKRLGEILGIEIHYFARVNFEGFTKIVDSLGGIDVVVEKDINDPYYPLGETTKYQTFSIKAGFHTLDGETALKYARSRKTTSDFDRAKRQQQIIAAVKDKALKLNLLTDFNKLQQLYSSISDSISTNLTVPEIIELAKIGKDINKDQISSVVLNDDFTSCGGFLYTPPRDEYGGAAVLIQIGKKYEEISKFIQNYFYSNIFTEQAPIQVLNATRVPGLAGKYLNLISRQCLNTIYYGNATNRDQDTSKIYYQPDQNNQPPAALAVIQEIIQAPAVAGIPAEYLNNEKKLATKIVIEIGKDYRTIAVDDPFDNIVIAPPATPTTATPATPEKPLSSLIKENSTDKSAGTSTQPGNNPATTDSTNVINSSQ